jgi:glycosyltransferase involved in cell wall biosynthesis
MNLESITVVLPTRNEAGNIGAFLASLPDAVHLIVVDASEDETPDLILRLRPARTQLLRRKSTITQARQLGAELAHTDWLLFTDADVVFPEGYFEVLGGSTSTSTSAGVVYGPKLSRDRFAVYYRWFGYGQQCSHWLGIPAATGSNLLVRKDALAAVGGFDPELVCNEDSELVWRIKRAGYRTRFDPALPVYARDHRRLDSGLWRKTFHSVFRCALLYWDLIPARWRGADWGYWSQQQSGRTPGVTRME